MTPEEIKVYIKENLSIDIRKEFHSDGAWVYVSILLEGEVVSEDYFYVNEG